MAGNDIIDQHEKYMRIALNVAHRGLGRTWPNPSVGCVIVKNGEIIAEGRTADGGRPHAETVALEKAGKKAEGATIYVTLEPCSHYGKTPPCAENIIKYKPKEVIIGCIDPDPRVSGKGIAMLHNAAIPVTSGILEKHCRNSNKGFFKRVETGLPYIMLKVAVSKDGKYLEGTGKPKWITGEEARNHVHLLRSQYDAILTGTGTVLADNPMLNCRLPGMENLSPVKAVIGTRPIPKTANIFLNEECWLFKDDIETTLRKLAEKGITRLMVEAGPNLSNSMLASGFVDEVCLFRSPHELGSGNKEFLAPDALNGFKKTSEQLFGDDVLTVYCRL